MKYLTLIPDYTGSCIQEDNVGSITLESLSIPTQLVKEINEWHQEYRKIIPLSDHDRSLRMEDIEKLDSYGLLLADKLRKMVPGGAKVRYYSEGKYKYL